MFRQQLASQLLIAIVSLVIAWPGPRPVVHSHDQICCSAKLLSEHIRRHHQGCPASEQEPDCSHFHWVFSNGTFSDFAGFSPGSQQALWVTGLVDNEEPFTMALPSTVVRHHARVILPAQRALFPQNYSACISRSRLCVWNC